MKEYHHHNQKDHQHNEKDDLWFLWTMYKRMSPESLLQKCSLFRRNGKLIPATLNMSQRKKV